MSVFTIYCCVYLYAYEIFLLFVYFSYLQLASRLKYHDPHFLRGQGEYEDQDDPEWLKNLANLVHNYNVSNLGFTNSFIFIRI